MRSCELASTSMADVVTHVRSEAPTNEVLVGLHRYAFHLPRWGWVRGSGLRKTLCTPMHVYTPPRSLAMWVSDVGAFRPKLALTQGPET